MEDGRWIWKSREEWPETIAKLDLQKFQAFYSCEKCRQPISQPPVYRVLHKILILKGWDWLYKWDENVIFVAVKKLHLMFHENCYNYQWLQKRHEVWWIP